MEAKQTKVILEVTKEKEFGAVTYRIPGESSVTVYADFGRVRDRFTTENVTRDDAEVYAYRLCRKALSR